jgi:hypothetical protein
MPKIDRPLIDYMPGSAASRAASGSKQFILNKTLRPKATMSKGRFLASTEGIRNFVM